MCANGYAVVLAAATPIAIPAGGAIVTFGLSRAVAPADSARITLDITTPERAGCIEWNADTVWVPGATACGASLMRAAMRGERFLLSVATPSDATAGDVIVRTSASGNVTLELSNIRGEDESLSRGGKSSGLMSFLKIGDRAAGAIKSGGTTRRAAKMVTVDIDHPDIEQYINWKVVEEQKVASLVSGSKLANKHLNAVIAACDRTAGDAGYDPKRNKALRAAIRDARKAMIPENYVQRVIEFAINLQRYVVPLR